MSGTVKLRVAVADPGEWVEEALRRWGSLCAGFPVDSEAIPAPLRAIRRLTPATQGVAAVDAEVRASCPVSAFWELVDFARLLQLPSPEPAGF